MDTKTFDKIISERLEECRNLLSYKAREYATDDRLHNFKIAAALQGVTPIEALAGMMAKHTVSVYDMCNGNVYPVELWGEKIGDSINYLLLLWALVMEDEMQKYPA